MSLVRCALVGMVGMVVGCAGPIHVELSPDDRLLDRVWLELSRGDLDAAEASATQVQDTSFRARALADVDVARRGRAHVVSDLITDHIKEAEDEDQPGWLAARFLSSGRRARSRLRAARSREGGHPALTLEDARRSGTLERREAVARGALASSPGGAEALAMLVESLLARRSYAEVAELLDDAPDTARLRLARRQLTAYTGGLVRAGDGLLDDMGTGLAVPASVMLLQQILDVVPLVTQEQRTLDLLASEETASPADRLQWPAERRLHARLLARLGQLSDAVRLAGGSPAAGTRSRSAEARLVERWARRDGAVAQPLDGRSLEMLIDETPGRTTDNSLLSLRLGHEWRLAARASYERVVLSGSTTDFDTFLDELDRAGEPLDAPFLLSDVPRIDYGFFGVMLDTQALRRHLPEAFVVGGKAMGMPPELTWYDLVSSSVVPLPEPLGGTYEECHVVNLRVPGFAASRGARFAGAGLDRFVFLDLDQVAVDAGRERVLSALPIPAWPAAGADQRRDLSEPLETAWRLTAAARLDAGDAYEDLVLEALSIHERRHIIDVREFFDGGVFDKISDVVSAGLLPGAVRAEVERRAQLDALREATDPRIPLAHAVSYLPAEGAAANSEHARGYASLVEDFLVVLDEEGWVGAQPLESFGLRRDRVLLQQLHKLPPEVIRDIADAVEL